MSSGGAHLRTARGFAAVGTGLAWLLLTALSLPALAGCEGCLPENRRRFGSTCGRDSECEGGRCFNGRCTKSCKSSAECGGGVCLESVCHAPELDYDEDTLTNGYELKFGLAPDKADTDDDGLLDPEEIGPDADNPLDSNKDGILDAAQSNLLDADGDCMVDALDSQPTVPGSPLPAAADLCKSGVCATDLSKVQVTCAPGSQTSVVLGCKGCVCSAPGLAGWQAQEAACDALDNDCDGKTDEDLFYEGLPLGSPCQSTAGPCALGGPGVVECGTDHAITCSTQGNGSRSLAKPEICNLVDDDCDGTTDDGFAWQGKPIGTPCQECGFQPSTCGDGLPLNPPLVSCDGPTNPEGVCGGVPFDEGFERLDAGLPQPRWAWSGALAQAWHRVLVYGGQVAGAKNLVERADLWSLDLAPAYGGKAAAWHLASGQPPGPRTHAALAWDATGDRVLLVGGRSQGQAALAVWSVNLAGEWTETSGLDPGNTAHVASLPPALGPVTADVASHAAVISLGGPRALVVFAPGQATPVQVRLDQAGAWQPVGGDPGGVQLACLAPAPDGSFALALDTGGTLRRLQANGQADAVTATVLQIQGPAALPPAAGQCVVDAKGQLHVFGGHGGSALHGGYLVGTFDAATAQATTVTFQEGAAPPAMPDLLQRSAGFAAWDAGQALLVVGGGRRRQAATDGTHSTGLADLVAWLPGTATPTALAAAAPPGRIGAGTGWSTAQNALLVAGGLRFDLPDTPAGLTRTLPLTDVWRHDAGSGWQRLADDLPPFAFGISAVGNGQVLLLAGGLSLAPDQAIPDIARLWEGRLLGGGALDPILAPTATVRAVAIDTGVATSVGLPGTPALAAPAQVYDGLRNRLLVFGGFDGQHETSGLFALQLGAEPGWTDITAQMPPLPDKPTARYGALAVYDPYRDVLAITAGSVRHFKPDGTAGNVGKDIAGKVDLGDCFGWAASPLWLTRTVSSPAWQPAALPAFVDSQSSPPQKPLLRPFFGGPAFLPVLFDARGGRAWLAAQQPDVPATDKAGQACPGGPSPVSWTVADVQITLDVGACGGAPAAGVQPLVLDPVPSALLLATSLYVDGLRQSLVWSGVEPDTTLSAALWRLGQVCKP